MGVSGVDHFTLWMILFMAMYHDSPRLSNDLRDVEPTMFIKPWHATNRLEMPEARLRLEYLILRWVGMSKL